MSCIEVPKSIYVSLGTSATLVPTQPVPSSRSYYRSGDENRIDFAWREVQLRKRRCHFSSFFVVSLYLGDLFSTHIQHVRRIIRYLKEHLLTTRNEAFNRTSNQSVMGGRPSFRQRAQWQKPPLLGAPRGFVSARGRARNCCSPTETASTLA